MISVSLFLEILSQEMSSKAYKGLHMRFILIESTHKHMIQMPMLMLILILALRESLFDDVL